jgi:GAF domain
MTQPSQSQTDTRGPLAEAVVALAGTPDDLPGIDVRLKEIVQLAADRVAAADYASVTALRDSAYSTVAASSELAEAVDEAQYAEQAGPCVQSLAADTPVTVPDVTTTMTWPGFREAAADMGLHASVSIPLFAGSGAAIAVLNLYGRHAAAMAPLIVGVWAVYDPDRPLPADHDDLQPLDAGGTELLAGFAEALAVRATIQLALGVIMGRDHTNAEDAYLTLRLQAAVTGVPLLTAAATTITAIVEGG